MRHGRDKKRGSNFLITISLGLMVLLCGGGLLILSLLPVRNYTSLIHNWTSRPGVPLEEMVVGALFRMQQAGFAGLILGTGILAARQMIAGVMQQILRDVVLVKNRLHRGLSEAFRKRPFPIISLILLTILAAILRARWLAEPITCDEAYSYTRFACRPIYFGIVNYSSANNHILNTVLVHLSSRLFGCSPLVLRLPAYLFSLCSISAAYLAFRTIASRPITWLATIMVVVSPVLIRYSVQSRGYQAMLVFFLLMFPVSRVLLKPRRYPSAWVLWGALGALGMFAIPAMFYGLAVHYIWMMLRLQLVPSAYRRHAIKQMFLAGVGVVLFTALIYTPAMIGVGTSYLRNQPDQAGALRLGGLMDLVLMTPIYLRLLWDFFLLGWPAVFIWSAAFLVIIGLLDILRRPHSAPAALFFACLLSVCIFSAVSKTLPYPRILILVQPLICLTTAAGLCRLIYWIPRISPTFRKTVLLTVGLLVLTFQGANALHSSPLDLDPALWKCPDSAAIAHRLSLLWQSDDALVTYEPTRYIIEYEMLALDAKVNHMIPVSTSDRYWVLVRHSLDNAEDVCEWARAYYGVDIHPEELQPVDQLPAEVLWMYKKKCSREY